MGLFSRLFGGRAGKSTDGSSGAFGPSFEARAAARDKRVASLCAMQDANALAAVCASETEICAALLGLSRLLAVSSSEADAAALAVRWDELAAANAPVFANRDVYFDPEMYFAARAELSEDVLLMAVKRLRHPHLTDFAVCTSSICHLLIDDFLETRNDAYLLLQKLFSRAQSPSPPVTAWDLRELMARLVSERCISASLVQYARIMGDMDEFEANRFVVKLTEPNRARSTASWLSQATTRQLWGTLVRQSARVDTVETIVQARHVDHVLRTLYGRDAAPLQADFDFGDLTQVQPMHPGLRFAEPDPILPADRQWYENLQAMPEQGVHEAQQVCFAGRELIYWLSRNWQECRRGVTWGNLSTEPDFSVLLLCTERPNPQVRLNAVRLLTELALAGIFGVEDPGTLHRDSRYETATADRVVPRLHALLASSEPSLRRASLFAARLFRYPELAPQISAALAWSDKIGSWLASQAVAEWIAAGSTEFYDQDTLRRLPNALASWQGGPHAAAALRMLAWTPGNDRERVHYAAARRARAELEADKDLTLAVLMHDLQCGAYAPVENAVWIFIGLGDADILPQLQSTLEKSGTKHMAEAYLNCGNSELYQAAHAWATRKGYTISTGSGAHPINWGAL